MSKRSFCCRIVLLVIFLLTQASVIVAQEQVFRTEFSHENNFYAYTVSAVEEHNYKVSIAKKGVEDEDAAMAVFTTLLLDADLFKIEFAAAFQGMFDGDVNALKIIGERLFFQTIGAVSMRSTIETPFEAGTITIECSAVAHDIKRDSIFLKGKLVPRKDSILLNGKLIPRKDSVLSKGKLIANKDGATGVDMKIRIRSVQIEFSEGFIQNISVDAFFDDSVRVIDNESKVSPKIKIRKNQPLKFENGFPFGFSTKVDYSYFFEYRLVEKNFGAGYVTLGEILQYTQNYSLNTRDFSPKDGVLVFEPCETRKLYKDEARRLIEVNVFSDFLGIDKEKPNGLIQMEADRTLNLNTRRFLMGSVYNGRNYGWFNYAKFTFSLSKVEQNNRRIPIQHSLNSDTTIRSFVRAIDLKNYETYGLGFNLNIFLFDWPQIKTTFAVDMGLRFGRTAFTDTLVRVENDNMLVRSGQVVNDGINTFSLFPQIRLEINPESRYGFTLFWRSTYYRALTNTIDQTLDNESPADYGKGRNFLSSCRITAFIKKNENKLFLRYTFNYAGNKADVNFSQIQVGYSFFLFDNQKGLK